MIVEVANFEEFNNKRKDYSPRYVRFLDANKNVLIGYNQGIKNFEAHLKEIETFFNSEDLPPGNYFFEVRRIMKNEGISYKISKENKSGAPIPILQPMQPQKIKTLIVDDAELLQLKVDNERMIYQMRLMQEEIDELNEYIEELENVEEVNLEDNGSPKWLDTLKDLIPTIAEPIMQEWSRANDIKQAQIGYNYEMLKVQNQQKAPAEKPTSNQAQNEIITFEELEQYRLSRSNDFYTWLSNPENLELYNNLKQNYETGI